MGIEQIPNAPTEPPKEQPPYPGWVLENGIWKKPDEKNSTKRVEQDEEGDHAKENKTDKELRFLEKELKELDNKEYLSPDDIQKKKELEIEYTMLDKQTKKTPKKKESASLTDKTKEEGQGEEKSKEEQKKEKLEKEITEKYYDELEKIKQMPDDTGDNRNLRAKKYFELINDWKDVAYLDDYKGIQKVFSELNKSKPSIFLYNWKKAETIDEVAIAMASNYKEWGLEDKEKLKIIKSFVKKQSKEKNFWYQSDDKDETLKDIAQILALKDVPFKDNVDIIVKDIESLDIKSKTIAKITGIEKESIEKKKQLLKEVREKMAKEKVPPEEKIKEQLKKMGASPEMEKIFQDPEALSKFFHEAFKVSKNPEVQEKFQELKNTVEKIIKGKEEIPESVAKAAEFIKKEEKKEKKESPWKTSFGTIGWSILLFLVLFMLAELKGVDYLAGTKIDITGGKKKEKK